MKFKSDSQRKAAFFNMNRFSNVRRDKKFKIFHVSREGEDKNQEDLARRDYGRDTGYFGTGIYGYKTKKPIEEEDDLIVEEIVIDNPLIIDTRDKSKELHDSIRSVHRAAFYPDDDDMKFETRIVQLSSSLRDLGVDVSPEEIKEEFLKDAEIVEGHFRKGKSAKGLEQAINRILKRRGYDGIVPCDEFADSGMYGCIKFKEEVNDEV